MARLHGHELTSDEVYVVGDTPRDIDGATGIGVGVGVGHYCSDQLRAAKADHVLGSLSEPFLGL